MRNTQVVPKIEMETQCLVNYHSAGPAAGL